VPDAIFADPRLVGIYDAFDGQRDDLAAYLSIVEEMGAGSVLDVGCGTGCLAVLLAERSLTVVGLDPDRRISRVRRCAAQTTARDERTVALRAGSMLRCSVKGLDDISMAYFFGFGYGGLCRAGRLLGWRTRQGGPTRGGGQALMRSHGSLGS
jgi:SAM-dependent methyltransferase